MLINLQGLGDEEYIGRTRREADELYRKAMEMGERVREVVMGVIEG